MGPSNAAAILALNWQMKTECASQKMSHAKRPNMHAVTPSAFQGSGPVMATTTAETTPMKTRSSAVSLFELHELSHIGS